jgi:Spy/CpxP family protein refolding chaperone
MKQGSKLVLAALAAGALGAAATAFAHSGERAGDGKQGAADCPMHTAMQQGEHRMGQGGHGKMEHRGMGQGMRHGQTQDAPKAE